MVVVILALRLIAFTKVAEMYESKQMQGMSVVRNRHSVFQDQSNPDMQRKSRRMLKTSVTFDISVQISQQSAKGMHR